MNREQLQKLIFSQFDKSAQELCKKTDGIFCEITSQYKSEEKNENLVKRFAKIYYKSFVIKFIYVSNGFLGTVKNALGCSVLLDKTEEATEILLPLFTDYCDIDIKNPLCFSLISNELAMEQVFLCIGNELVGLLDLIADVSYNNTKKENIINTYNRELKYVFDIKDSDDFPFYEDVPFSDFFISRLTADSFINYLKGDYKKTIKSINKIKKLTGYEKRVVRLLNNAESIEKPELSELVENATFYNSSGMPKNNGKEFLAVLLSWIVLTPATSAVFVGLFFLFVFIEKGADSVYLMGPTYNFPITIMFGAISSMIISYFLRFKFYKLVDKRNYKRYREIDYMQNNNNSDKLMKFMLIALTCVSITGTFLLAKWNLNFLSEGFYDNSKFFSIKGEYHSYDEIDKVFYRPDRINGLGETIDYDSYVILLANGKEIDLYEHGEIKDYEDKLLDFFVSKGINVEKNKK